ncbi:MAG TPA: right-handed parallel beta-helix repeat-containing protein [Armatimonadota bacterium]|jgi:parallel beta-helix repeat protein
MNRTARMVVAAFLATALTLPSDARIWYVASQYSGGSSSGETWREPSGSIGAVLAKAAPGDEVHVAAGTYREKVVLPDGVKLLGGYPANGDTYGDGDIRTLDGATVIWGGDMWGGIGGIAVTIATGAGAGTVLDGFTVTAGYSPTEGGGILCRSASPVISRCIVMGNSATWGGGIACLGIGAPHLVGNTITGNTAASGGGGVYVSGTLVKIEGNVISGNTAPAGAGVYLDGGSGADITSCVLTGNTATGNGGACLAADGATGNVANNTITRNTAAQGGAADLAAGISVRNNIIAGNSSGIRASGASLLVEHNCFHANGPYDALGIPNAVGSNGNFSADPGFALLPPGDFHLADSSPCRNAGDDSAVAPGAIDIDGKPRVQGAHVDIGADETSALVIRVGQGGDDAADGLTWATAKKTLQAAVNAAAATGGEVWVQKGVYAEHIVLAPSVALYGGFNGAETFRSQRDAASRASVLDAGHTGPGVVLGDAAGPETVLDGFTVRNSDPTTVMSDPPYSAVYAMNASPVIRNNTFLDNHAGVYIYKGIPVVAGNRFVSNQAYAIGFDSVETGWVLSNVILGSLGTGIGTGGGAVRVSGNVIRGCGQGAGLYGGVAFVNNTVYGNKVGINYTGPNPNPIANNIVAFNGVSFSAVPGSPAPRSNCIFGNIGVSDAGTALIGQNGNIGVDPKLVAAADGTLHLASGSPCIDSGDTSLVQPNDIDVDGLPRVYGSGVDIGADEYDGTVYAPLPAAVQRVKPGGDDALDGATWPTAKKSVQAAIDALKATGGEVWVQAGTYSENLELGSGISLFGGFAGNETAREARDWRSNVTVLSAAIAQTVITVRYGSGATAEVDGFTIRNGRTTWGDGGRWAGGIDCDGVVAFIRNNTLAANGSAADGTAFVGGGIRCVNAGAVITGNTITGNVITPNSTSSSSGVYVEARSPLYPVSIANNVVVGNSGGMGAVYLDGYAGAPTSVVRNNTIVANSPGQRGALVFPSSAIVSGNIVAYNGRGVDLPTTGSTLFQRNDVFGNTQYDYRGGAVPAGSGNISADPRLAAVYGNVHIQPDSPCRNEGDSLLVASGETDMDGQARAADGLVDMGADESDGTVYAVAPLVLRVSPGGDDANTGASWSAAKRTVQAAIDAAKAASGGEVWVAAGLYTESITLPAFVYLYGGFAGTETAREQRNWRTNASVLDGAGLGRVVTVTGGSRYGAIDGFTIRNGSMSGGTGGGIYCSASFPAVSNNTFIGNVAATGGAISLYGGEGGTATVTNNTFIGNVALNTAGAIWCVNGASTLISGCRFQGNTSPEGSAVRLNTPGSAILRNNTFAGNQGAGGAVTLSGPMTLENNIVASNASGIALLSGGSATFRNNCVFGNGSAGFKGVTDPTGTDGNISADPRLAAPAFGNLHIQPDSPCVDAGGGAVPPESTDMDGQPRVQGARVDIGADESDGTAWPVMAPAIVRVSAAGSDSADGSSWSLAKRSVQAAIEAAAVAGGEVWVAAGTYPEHITLRPFTYVYGGFSGVETARDERRWGVNRAVIDGGGTGPVVTARQGAVYTTVDGFTLRNGKGLDYGGGVVVRYSSPTISHNIITSNTASYGGGVWGVNATGVIRDNLFYSNSATNAGGGLYLSGGSPHLANNTIVDNSTVNTNATGGGIYLYASTPVLAGNIIAHNTSGLCGSQSTPVSRNNCIALNGTADFFGITDFTGANGNIRQDPRLADRATADYRLLPTSRCIDAGGDSDSPAGDLDLDGGPRSRFAHVDIGAYESAVAFQPGVLPIVRVSPTGSDANTGASWGSPLRTLATALDVVAPDGEIWLAAGTYVERNTLLSSVGIYGGFAGTETERVQRDFVANVTVFDGAKAGSMLVIPASSGGSIIDGLTFANGSGTWVIGSPSSSGYLGGAVYCDGSAPVLRNNTFRNNFAYCGGAVAGMNGASPELRSSVFTTNGVYTDGAAVYFVGGSPVIADNTFTANKGDGTTSSTRGPLYFQDSAPVVRGNTIADNTAPAITCINSAAVIEANTVTGNKRTSFSTTLGGGIYCTGAAAPTIRRNRISGNSASSGGGIYIANPALVANNIVTGNTATTGGGVTVYSQAVQPGPLPVIRNNTIVGNSAGSGSAGGLLVSSATVVVENNIFAWGTGYGVALSGIKPVATVRNNLVYGNSAADFSGFPSPAPLGRDGNFKADPLFIDRAGGDYHLQAASPALDGGADGGITPGDVDFDGQPRLRGLHVDIGAYELPLTPYTFNDVKTALRLAAGLAGSSTTNLQRVNIESVAPSGDRVTILDALRLVRKAAGLELNP